MIPSEEPIPSTHDAAVAARVAERDHTAIARGLVREVATLQGSIAAALAIRPR